MHLGCSVWRRGSHVVRRCADHRPQGSLKIKAVGLANYGITWRPGTSCKGHVEFGKAEPPNWHDTCGVLSESPEGRFAAGLDVGRGSCQARVKQKASLYDDLWKGLVSTVLPLSPGCCPPGHQPAGAPASGPPLGPTSGAMLKVYELQRSADPAAPDGLAIRRIIHTTGASSAARRRPHWRWHRGARSEPRQVKPGASPHPEQVKRSENSGFSPVPEKQVGGTMGSGTVVAMSRGRGKPCDNPGKRWSSRSCSS